VVAALGPLALIACTHAAVDELAQPTAGDDGPPTSCSPEATAEGLCFDKPCSSAHDCPDGTCRYGFCIPTTATDGVKNGSETDVDCGGGAAPGCVVGKKCVVRTDCVSLFCTNGTCTALPPQPGPVANPLPMPKPIPIEGTDASVPDASDGGRSDAASASHTDGVKNGDETDVDCGGSSAPRCATAKACKVHGDCASGGCNYRGQCAAARSCVNHHGGDTCGPGADGDPNGQFEDCCVSPGVPRADGTLYLLDKFVVTAGRVRAFVEAAHGDLRGFTRTIPASNPWWNHDWDQYIPSTTAEVDAQLGPYPAPLTPDPINPAVDADSVGQFREGCQVSSGGARSWWTAAADAPQGDTVDHPKDMLDEKAINCIDAYLLTAFCIWDGGHLATADELARPWELSGGPWPWSDRAPNVDYDPMRNLAYGRDSQGRDASAYVVHEFGREFEGPFSYAWPNDYTPSSHLAAPGRKPLGNAPTGHADLAGLVYEIGAIGADDHTHSLLSGSWGADALSPIDGAKSQGWPNAWWAYWAAGGRCAR
jgi:hypothetical protein